MKPIIGITVDANPEPGNTRTQGKLTLNWNYAQVIADAGGVPLLIPPQADPDEIVRIIDGWLIPGGNDIDPRHWGEPLHPKAELIAEERHNQERAIYQRIPRELPVLGVCYGCQFINVMEGGSLIQHLPDVVSHERDQRGTMQAYEVDVDSLTAGALGTSRSEGESWHHQALGAVPGSLKVVAKNEDGTVEAIESCSRPWMIGVQWHPERTADATDSSSLFRSFVNAAAEYRRRRA